MTRKDHWVGITAPVAATAEADNAATARPAAAAGDPPGHFVDALLEHHQSLRTLARGLARDRATAEDLVQATLERALRQAERFRAGTNLRAWLTRVMRNLFTDLCRRQAIERRLCVAPLLGDAPAPEAPAPCCYDLYSMADIMSAIDALDADHRTVFLMAHVKQLSYKTIGALLRIPVSTVGTRLLRARSTVRRRMVDERALRVAGVDPIDRGPGRPRRGGARPGPAAPSAPAASHLPRPARVSPIQRRSRATA
jgi:RNA polymerase sigma-70 factor (ECF subfamily)